MKNFTFAEIVKNPFQMMLFIFGVINILILVPLIYVCYNYINNKIIPNAPPGYKWPCLSDMRPAFIGAVMYAAVKHYVTGIFYYIFVPICKD